MGYSYSHLDKKNLQWFDKNDANGTLLSMKLKGKIRGVQDCKVEFKYPITVISGRNGSGKSTILALAACAYHNSDNGFKLQKREHTYYTFSDFFIQSSEEIKPDGLQIWNEILYKNWRPSSSLPNEKGVVIQKREKKKGGRWTNYERRVKRNVVFLGIDRIVPHSEKSAHKSYRSRFKSQVDNQEVIKGVLSSVGCILNKDYSAISFKKHGKYRLPITESQGTIYSGFNMGAGENAMFDLFYILYRLPKGSLIIIDEIELGLYDEAQVKLIDELKVICNKKYHQIICTSHSSQIIKSLPPEGRIHVESFEHQTILNPGISAQYATGKLRGKNSNELDIYVEDSVAGAIIKHALSFNTRERVNVIPIGSSTSVIRQLAARYKDLKHGNCMAFLDGDKSSIAKKNINEFLNCLESHPSEKEKEKAKKWSEQRINYLPGTTWPERWIFETVLNCDLTTLTDAISISEVELKPILRASKRAGKHNEFYTMAKACNMTRDIVISDTIKCLLANDKIEFDKIAECVKKQLH